jgi:hypothetical protein
MSTDMAFGEYGTLFNYRSGLDLNWRRTERWGVLWRKVYWDAELNRSRPLTYFDKRLGLFIRPCSPAALEDGAHFLTDLGSVLPPVQSFFPSAEAPYAYFFHDQGYRYGGLWVSETYDGPYQFLKMTRREVDDLCLRCMLQAGGVSLVRRNMIYDAVRVGGWAAWEPQAPGK